MNCMHQIPVSKDISVIKIKRYEIILIINYHRLRIYTDSHRTYKMSFFPETGSLSELHDFNKSESLPVKS